jgi:hypothetical protein
MPENFFYFFSASSLKKIKRLSAKKSQYTTIVFFDTDVVNNRDLSAVATPINLPADTATLNAA